MLGDKLPSAGVRAFARYAPVDLTHTGSAETCRDEIVQFLGGDIPEFDLEGLDNTSGKIQAVLCSRRLRSRCYRNQRSSRHHVSCGGIIDEASGYLPPDALPFNLSMYVNDEGLYSCQPNRAFYATESMEHEGYYSAIDGKPVVSGLPSSLLFGNIVITGYDPESGEDKSLSAGEMMDAMNYFQRESPRGEWTRGRSHCPERAIWRAEEISHARITCS